MQYREAEQWLRNLGGGDTVTGIELPPEQEAALLQAARRVRDSERDEFFEHVASLLRPIGDLRPSDVHHAIGAALADLPTVKRDEAANV